MRIGHHLKRLCESHGGAPRERIAEVSRAFVEAITPDASGRRRIDLRAVHLAELAEAFLGTQRLGYGQAERKLRMLAAGRAHLLEEAQAAVDASAFADITGQLLVTVIKEKYQSPEFIARRMMRKFPNPGANLGPHIIPYLSDVVDKPQRLAQQEPYPHTQFKESWVTMPAPEKYGLICATSMEMLLSDFTGQAQDSASSVGRSMGYQEEEQCAAVMLGLSTFTNGVGIPYSTASYVWNGNTINTYVTTAGTGNYSNRLANNFITNWTNINTIEQKFVAFVDPITGRRINAWPSAIYCDPAKRYYLKRILNATETRSGSEASDTGNLTVAENPLETRYQLHSSPIWQNLLLNNAKQNTGATLTAAQVLEFCLFFDPQKAFGYREVYPMRTEEAPALNFSEFHQDIALQVKVSRFGVPFVYDPRWSVESSPEAT
jgi:hypothetical protein